MYSIKNIEGAIRGDYTVIGTAREGTSYRVWLKCNTCGIIRVMSLCGFARSKCECKICKRRS